jgi:hypothetical protein
MVSGKDNFTDVANDNKPISVKTPVMAESHTRMFLAEHRAQLSRDLRVLLLARSHAKSSDMYARFEKRLKQHRIRQVVQPTRFDDSDILFNLANEFNRIDSKDLLDTVYERLQANAEKVFIEKKHRQSTISQWMIGCKNTAYQIDRFKKWEETVYARCFKDKTNGSNDFVERYINEFLNYEGIISVKRMKQDMARAYVDFSRISSRPAIIRSAKILRLNAFS